MKTSIAILALAAAGFSAPVAARQAAATAPAVPAQQSPAEPTPSPKAGPAIIALQTAITAHDTANIPAKLAAAEAAATTPADRYWIARVQLNGAIAANDLVAAQKHVDAIAASNALPVTSVADLYRSLASNLLGAKQYDQAVAVSEKASALAPSDPRNLLMIAQVRSEQGRKGDAAAAIQRAIATSKTAGQNPSEDLYKNAAVLAYEAKLPTTMSLAREWVSAYPSDAAWRNALAIYRNLNGGDPDNITDVTRLSRLTNAMQTGSDYEAAAAKAIDERNFGEAKAVINEAIASRKHKASDATVTELLAATKGKVPSAAELAAAERAASIPNAYLRVGDRYYAAGDYAKAAALYRQALAKGVDSNLANLRLGEALARAGDKAGATAALNAVTGSRSDLAKFWLLYVQTHA